jgi:anti-anti-sigma factor
MIGPESGNRDTLPTSTEEYGVRMSLNEMGGVPTVRVEGDLDAATADAFQQTLLRAADEDTSETLQFIIDLERCAYIDSAGLGVLFALTSRARQVGGRIAVVKPPAQVLHILQLVRLTDERGFEVYSDLHDARAALQGP